MIPILFEKSDTTFTTNGLCRLAETVRCLVTEERNGVYELELDYPVTGEHFSDIQIGRIIACTHDEAGDVQPFDIYEKSEPLDGIVTFYAHHISYRLNEIVVEPFTASTCATAIAGLKTNSIGTNPFSFSTDKSVSASYEVTVPKSLRGLLGGEEGSLLDVFGTGEYKFDLFNVYLYSSRGTDTDVSIRYGKNLVEFENEVDYSETYNAIVPYWYGENYDSSTGTSTGTLVTLSEKYIQSNNALPSGRTVMVPLDMSSDFESQPTQANLRTAATSKLSDSYAWLPLQNIKVDFVQLWQTAEYASLAPLQKVSLCDTVVVDVPMYNISGLRIKVIKVVWNTLLDRYDEMELGTPSATFASVISNNYDTKYNQTTNELRLLREELVSQVDAKIETWAQSTNPASAWTTADLREQHDGDLWLYTGTSNMTVDGVTIHPQGIYKYNASTQKWEAYSSTSANLFDLVDGKTTIFYGTNTGTYTGVQVGDYLVDSTNGKTYRWNGSSWVLQLDYNTAVGNAKVTRVETEYCLSNSNSTFSAYGSWSTQLPQYVQGKYYWKRTVTYYADGTSYASAPILDSGDQSMVETNIAFNSMNNHFWYDNTGAYVTEDEGTYSTGYATRITNAGILQSYNGALMSSWTNSGINFYANDGSQLPIAQFGSSAILGTLDGYHSELNGDGFKISNGPDDILNINASGESRTETVTTTVINQTPAGNPRSTMEAMAYGTSYTVKVITNTTVNSSFTVSVADSSTSLPSTRTVDVGNQRTVFTYSRLNDDYFQMNVAQSVIDPGGVVGTYPKVTKEYTRVFAVPVMDFEGDFSAHGDIDITGDYKVNGTKINAAYVGAVPTSRTVQGHALSSNVTLGLSTSELSEQEDIPSTAPGGTGSVTFNLNVPSGYTVSGIKSIYFEDHPGAFTVMGWNLNNDGYLKVWYRNVGANTYEDMIDVEVQTLKVN